MLMNVFAVPYREGWLYTLEGLKLAVRVRTFAVLLIVVEVVLRVSSFGAALTA